MSAGRFGNNGGLVMCGRGFVSGGFCVLFIGAWFCAWSTDTTTACGSHGGFCFGGFSVKVPLPLHG